MKTTTIFNTEYVHASNIKLTHSVTSLEQLKECIKAATVFGLVVANIEGRGEFTTNTHKQSKEDKEIQDWYENSEHNTRGYIVQYDDENTTIQSYWKLVRVEGKSLIFTTGDNEIKVRFPMFPKAEEGRSSYNSMATLLINFTTPDSL